ncbi:hypothetical protein BH11MYX1_BH11MYX1_55550 [soil metagenome]
MRLARGLVLAALSLPLASPTFAGPLTVGVGAGVTQDGVNASQDPLTTESVFARIGLTQRLSAELDIQKTNQTTTSIDAKVVTGLAVLDLGSHALGLVPQVFAGRGIDRSTTSYTGETDGHHFEAGAGLEYRAAGGLTIGARFHIGQRTIDTTPNIYYATDTAVPCCGGDVYAPSSQNDGEFRSLDAYAGIRF